MNKKTIRIAGWALGLSMAVAGIGTVSGMSMNAPMETKATAAAMTAGTNGSEVTVNGKDAIKVGTNSKGGDMTITVPAGATSLSFYAAAWKGVTGLSLNLSGATASIMSFALTADDGISGSSPFMLSGDESDFEFSTTLSGITEETDITLTSSIAKRFVVWGAEYATKTLSSISFETHPTKTTYYAGDVFDPTGLSITRTYSDSSSDTYTYAGHEDEFSFTPALSTALTEENTEITIGYGGKTVAQAITVNPARTLESISISSTPTKTAYYEGETFDPTGLVITRNYNSGDPDTYAYAGHEGDFTFTPSLETALTTADGAITIAYGGKSAAQTIEVTEAPKAVTYSVNSKSAATTSGTKPDGSSVGYANSGSNNNDQMTKDNTETWTLNGYAGKTIKSIKADLKRNASSGSGTAALTNNSVSQNASLSKTVYEQSDLTGTYTEYELLSAAFDVEGPVVLTLTSTANSFWCDYIVVTWEDSDLLDSSLSLSGYTDAFTVGDSFSFGGTATANYSISGAENVTSKVEYSLGGSTIEIGDEITADMVGTKEVEVTYEDPKGHTATDSYDVTISYADVASVNISTSRTEMTKIDSFTYGATVLPANANQNVTWSASSATLVEDDDFSIDSVTGELTVTASDAGKIRVTATTIGKDGLGASKTAYIDIDVIGDPTLTLDKTSIADAFTGKSGALEATPGNFTGTPTYTWTSSNPSAVTIEGSDANVTINYVGVGTSTITCTASYGGVEEATANCTVVVAASEVTSLEWSASDFHVFEGQTLSELPGVLTATWNNGDEPTHPDSGYTLSIGGSAISLPHVWASSDDGKAFAVTYGGQSASVNVSVTESLELIEQVTNNKYTYNAAYADFNGQASGSTLTLAGVPWTITRDGTNTNSATGSIPQIGTGSSPETFSLRTTAITGRINKISVTGASKSGAHRLTATVDGNTYINEATSSWTTLSEKSGTGTSSGEIVITFTKGTGAAYLSKIVIDYSSSSPINNTNASAQSALISFAKLFNSVMACDGTNGNTENVAFKWASLSASFGDVMDGLSSSDLAVFKALVANASAIEGGDTLQDMLARYDYIVAKYKVTDFLNEDADRPEVSGVGAVDSMTPSINAGSSSSPLILTIISVGVLTTGGFFLISRKRREEE